MHSLNTACAEDDAFPRETAFPRNDQHIDHKRLRQDAIHAAELIYASRRDNVDEAHALSTDAERIARTGLPGAHVKNIGSWFYKAFLRDARQQADLAAHQERSIGKHGMPIVSQVVFNSRQRQLATQKRRMEQQELYYVDEKGDEICLSFSDVWNTPEKRAAKHYVRIKGLEKYCRGLGLAGYFLTLTLPAEYHPNPSMGQSRWSGLTPKQGHDEMQQRWRSFQRRFGKTTGVRVEEQHLDGCVHWHALVWIPPERTAEFSEKLHKYFGEPPASQVVPIDLSRATAASYLMKYVLKATGAEHSSADEAMRAEAARADAHRATWGGRSIVFFDVAGSSTIWDEVRRIKADSSQHKQLSTAGLLLHHAATSNDYCLFLETLRAINTSSTKTCRILYTNTSGASAAIQGLVVEDADIVTRGRKNWTSRQKKQVQPATEGADT